MQLTQPTPHETAQWILEAHAENILGEMSDPEHAEFMTHLETACEEMDAADLRSVLGAAVDIAQELTLELSHTGVEPDRILEIVRHGRGRLHVARGLPAHPSAIGVASALRLAEAIARTAVWVHAARGCDDERSLEAFDIDCEEVEDAIRTRSLGQLLLVGHWLRLFSDALGDAGAQNPVDSDRCVSTDGAGCRGHIDDWEAVISAQSEYLCVRSGSMDNVWVLHRDFFTDACR